MATAMAMRTTRAVRTVSRSGSVAGTAGGLSDLDADVECDLIRRWQGWGDRDALDALMCSCLPKIECVVRLFGHYPVAYEDLVGEGYVGLMLGINRFDTEAGIRLMTYVFYWVRSQLVRRFPACEQDSLGD
jgi:DNA-directed RNA polymerase sigma subunit (sigma70/sigma32)